MCRNLCTCPPEVDWDSETSPAFRRAYKKGSVSFYLFRQTHVSCCLCSRGKTGLDKAIDASLKFISSN